MEPQGDNFEGLIKEFEKNLLQSTLQRFQGDKTAAMAALKLPRATFYRKLSQLGLIN
jgi:DNA-binding NtrC family response regulator